MRRRVVVTGIGWITPLGVEIETVWKRLIEGQSGVGYITLFDASNFPTKISAEVRDWDVSDVGEDPVAWKDREDLERLLDTWEAGEHPAQRPRG